MHSDSTIAELKTSTRDVLDMEAFSHTECSVSACIDCAFIILLRIHFIILKKRDLAVFLFFSEGTRQCKQSILKMLVYSIQQYIAHHSTKFQQKLASQ